MSAYAFLDEFPQFVDFGGYKIRSELEYQGRLELMCRLASSGSGTACDRWWSLLDQLDDWVCEDRAPFCGPPEKKFRLDPMRVDPVLRQMFPPDLSPPAQPNRRTPSGGQGAAASRGLAGPLTPPELVANTKTAEEILKAEIIARNRAAALQKREQQRLLLNENRVPPETPVRVQ